MANKKAAAALTLIVLLLIWTTLASAQSMSLDEQGIRFYVPEGWQIITENDVLEKGDIAEQIGTTAQVMKAQFDAHGILLYALDDADNAFVLKSLDSPLKTYTGDVYAFSSANREQFLLALLEASPGTTGSWDLELPTFVCLSWKKDVQGLPVYTLAFQTLMYGRIISFECESFGAPASDKIIASLRDGARAILFLGAKAQAESKLEPSSLFLPKPMPNEGKATISRTRDDVPLEVDSLPLTITSSLLVVTGKTTPGIDLRYYMNGVGIERFKADEQGMFKITVKKFTDGENLFKIDAIDGKAHGTIAARITLDRDVTPATLLETEITTDASSYHLYGITLPDAQVMLKSGSSSTKVPVNTDGTFTTSVKLSKVRDYPYTFEVTSNYYKKNKLSVVIHHEESLDEAISQFKKDAANSSGLQKAASGEVHDLINIENQRYVVFDTVEAERMLIRVKDFLAVDKQMQGEMLMTLTGDMEEYEGSACYIADWFAFIPEN